MIDKKEEKDFEFIYAYFVFLHILSFMYLMSSYVFINKKGEKVFGKRILDLCFVSHLIDAYMFV